MKKVEWREGSCNEDIPCLYMWKWKKCIYSYQDLKDGNGRNGAISLNIDFKM